MGGPRDLSEVEDYIFQLLADPDMVRLPCAALLQRPLARFIARRRSPKVRQRYAVIGGRSPLNADAAQQAQLLGERLGLPVAHALRYTPPQAEQAVAMLAARGVQRLVALPLYPQYSSVSTLSALKDLDRGNAGRLPVRAIDRHFSDPGYISALRELLQETLGRIKPRLRTHLLFVAHSIPEAYIAAGDPYVAEVEATVQLVSAGLEPRLPQSLAYSSRVGPLKWRGPALAEELDRLARQGVEQLVVHPVSFVSENLETLFDLDIEFKRQCAERGLHEFLRVPALGCAPAYISALAGLVQRQIAQWEGGDA